MAQQIEGKVARLISDFRNIDALVNPDRQMVYEGERADGAQYSAT